ncbi:hypothetical protein LINPERHAP1_LOCUS14946 [Linum perenne]
MKKLIGEGINVRIWRASKDGKYTVRSAYRIATEELGTLSNLYEHREWRKLWDINIRQS